ncbi:MAG TPA: EAL domain-containing protein [Acidimicrobiales bacterium]|nr:EAL domain-containing protein [Acidimicrobiales bacterium]
MHERGPRGEVEGGGRPDATAPGTLTTELVGRLSGVLWVACGLMVVAAGPLLDFPRGASRPGVEALGVACIAMGLVVRVVPWARWPRSATLWLVPVAFGMIALHNRLAGDDGFLYGTFYLVVFVWVGLAHPRWTSLRLAPLLAASYVLPLLGTPMHRLGVASALYVVPCCLVVGEVVAWVGGLLRRSESALVDAEERFRNAFEQAPIGIGLASPDGHLVRVNRAYGEILGRDPAALVGRVVREFTHPEDWEENAAQFRSLVAGDIDRYQLEKRYIHADGHVVWVTVSATCVRDEAGGALYVIGQIEDVTERREMRERLAHAAVHDQLTGLPNRVLFMDRLELALSRARRDRHHVAIMFLDLDRFKLVNDSLGHESGDLLLGQVARRLGGALRAVDTLARFGGDEFTVLCEVAERAEAVDIAERLVGAMLKPLTLSGIEMFVSVSVGIALSIDGAESPAEMLRNADVAMYRAKELGPSRIEVYRADDESRTIRRLRTSNELHRALERDELELHYQPMVDLHDETMVGIEALVRWHHPTRGLLLPGEFIALAEDSGLIVPLGAWVLREACRQTALWEQRRAEAGQDTARLNISVNVSAQQLADSTFPRQVASALGEPGLDPDKLWLEITESTLMSTGDATAETLAALRALGLHLEIDDFGTGYSSLSYLKRLPVETLKIDRSFVDELDCDSDDVAIVRAIVALGESLGLAVVAEGIERTTQATELQDIGCHLAQGYLYGFPRPAWALEPFPADDLRTWQTEFRSTA